MITKKEILSSKKPIGNKLSAVYFLIKNSEIVYIGASINCHNRVLEHKDTKDFDSWSHIDTDIEDLAIVERRYIKDMLPKYNKVIYKDTDVERDMKAHIKPSHSGHYYNQKNNYIK